MNPTSMLASTVAGVTATAAVAAIAAVATAVALSAPSGTLQAAQDDASISHGRYVVKTAGCNDCHTPGYAAAEGQVDEKLWLIGDSVGWTGPWGTTYATNLRLYLDQHTEDSWLKAARAFRPRPPMPWFNVHAMNDRDLRSLYRYVRSLGPAGQPAPAYLPPGRVPAGPAIRFPG